MAIIDPVSFSIAALGAVLGVINTWRAYKRDQLNIRVIPKAYISSKNGFITVTKIPDKASSVHKLNPNFDEKLNDVCIEVTNLSVFPVTISEAGFYRRESIDRFLLRDYLIPGERRLPILLEPRSSFTIYVLPDHKFRTFYHLLKSAYIITDCDVTVKGTSSAFKAVVRRYARMQNLNY